MSNRWIDLTHPLNEGTPPFPGDPAVEVTVLDSTDQSDRKVREHLNCSRVATCVHCGTHMDAPVHFFGNGTTIDAVDLDVCVGTAVLADLGVLAPHTVITPDLLEPFADAVRRHGRIVLATGWSSRWQADEYFTDHPVIDGDGAAFLVACGARLVGVDFPSVDHPPHPAHLQLLGNDVLIVENLTNLQSIEASEFQLMALPLRLTERDGSPVRAVARVDNASSTGGAGRTAR